MRSVPEGGAYSFGDRYNNNCIRGERTSKSAAQNPKHSSSLKSFSFVYSKTTQSVAMNSNKMMENEEIVRNEHIHDVNDLCDDFASTFMLDEELELEQKMLRRNGLAKR